MFEKVTQLATRALVAVRKKEKISKSEMTTLTYFDNLKKKNKINAVKTGVTEGFISICMWNLTPDERLHVKVFKKRTKEL